MKEKERDKSFGFMFIMMVFGAMAAYVGDVDNCSDCDAHNEALFVNQSGDTMTDNLTVEGKVHVRDTIGNDNSDPLIALESVGKLWTIYIYGNPEFSGFVPELGMDGVLDLLIINASIGVKSGFFMYTAYNTTNYGAWKNNGTVQLLNVTNSALRIITNSDGDNVFEFATENNIPTIRHHGGDTLKIDDELNVSGISGDGTGQVVCIKSDGNLGTCTTGVNASGFCTCS